MQGVHATCNGQKLHDMFRGLEVHMMDVEHECLGGREIFHRYTNTELGSVYL